MSYWVHAKRKTDITETGPGSTITVGPTGRDYDNIADAVTNANDNDIIEVYAGTYTDDLVKIDKSLTLRAMATANIRLSAKNAMSPAPFDYKAPWLAGTAATNPDITIEGPFDFDFSNITTWDGTDESACIRWQSGRLTIQSTVNGSPAFKNSCNGVMGNGDWIVVDDAIFTGNGQGNTGLTHQIYVSVKTTNAFTIKNSTFNAMHSSGVGHHVKSRAIDLTVQNNTFAASQYSRAVDIVHGGTALIEDNVVNHDYNLTDDQAHIIGFGSNNDAGNAHPTHDFLVRNNTITNTNGPGSLIAVHIYANYQSLLYGRHYGNTITNVSTEFGGNWGNATIAAMSSNTWTQLEDGTSITTGVGILSYSSMAYDPKNYRLLMFGGGHADGFDDRIWAFDLENETWSAYSSGYGSDPITLGASYFDVTNYNGAIFNPTTEDIADANPLSRHTYQTLEYDSTDEVISISGQFTWGDNADGDGFAVKSAVTGNYKWTINDLWFYNYATNKFEWISFGGTNGSNTGAAYVYDSSRDCFYQITRLHRTDGSGGVWKYTKSTKTWSKPFNNTASGSAQECSAVYDPDRDMVWLFGGDKFQKYDPDLNTLTNITGSSGSPPPFTIDGMGIAYDKINQKIYTAYSNSGTVNCHEYDPDTDTWTAKANGPASLGGRSDRHLNWVYDDINRAFLAVVHRSSAVQTYAYKV